MSYRHTLEATLESLKDIEELIKGFPASGKIPAIDIDLVLQKIRNMYELMLMMKKSSASDSPFFAPAANTAPAPVAATATAATTVAPPPAPPTSPAPDSSPQTPPPATASTNASPPSPTRSAKEVQTLADQFKGKPTLHESLHQSFAKENETLSRAKPVRNLMEAIGINDRFTFIRELFDGDSAAFESAIKFLNEATSFNDAYNYMIRYFNWDMDSEAVQMLLDIIRRKFIKGRHE